MFFRSTKIPMVSKSLNYGKNRRYDHNKARCYSLPRVLVPTNHIRKRVKGLVLYLENNSRIVEIKIEYWGVRKSQRPVIGGV